MDHAVVLAGGSGTRFWPESRTSRSKQFLDLTGGGPMIRETLDRLRPVVPPERLWIVAGLKDARHLSPEALGIPKGNILLEPEGKNTAPAIALAAAVTAFFYIPLWGVKALFSFNGDLIVVLYLLLIPSLTFFLGGWYSRSVYSMTGAVRSLVQLFAYEVPLFLAVLAPALLANTWSLSGVTAFYAARPALWIVNLLGFGVALVTLLGKLEKVPFDIAEAETEVVAGPFTEYSGQRLAFLRLTMDVEMIVASALLAAVFMPFGLNVHPVIGLVIFLSKILFIVFLVALARSLFARLRLDQMIEFCWKYLAPLAFLQLLLDLIVKGAIYR